MSDISIPSRPLLQPVLTLRKEPIPRAAIVQGKKEEHVVRRRLKAQRESLAFDVRRLRSQTSAGQLNVFGGYALLVAEMFEDSFATTWTPRSIFRAREDVLTRGATSNGYLVEIDVDDLDPQVIELHFLHQHLFAFAIQSQVEQVGAVIQMIDDFLAGKTDGNDGFLMPVNHAGKNPRLPQTPVGAASQLAAGFGCYLCAFYCHCYLLEKTRLNAVGILLKQFADALVVVDALNGLADEAGNAQLHQPVLDSVGTIP